MHGTGTISWATDWQIMQADTDLAFRRMEPLFDVVHIWYTYLWNRTIHRYAYPYQELKYDLQCLQQDTWTYVI